MALLDSNIPELLPSMRIEREQQENNLDLRSGGEIVKLLLICLRDQKEGERMLVRVTMMTRISGLTRGSKSPFPEIGRTDIFRFATHTQRGPRAIPPPQDQKSVHYPGFRIWIPLKFSRQLARKRGTSVHRRLPHEDGPLSQGHDMVENQQGHPHRQPARSRATSVIRGGIDLNSTRVNPQANDIQDDDMGDPPQEGDTQQRPTRGRAPRPTHRGAGYEGPTRVNTPEEAQATSAPHRIRGVGQDDQRQSHSVPTNRRAVGEYEVTRRDEVVGNSIPLARGRSRIPDSQNPDVFTSVDHSPQRPGRGRLAASARTHDDDHHPRGNYQEDRAPSRPPPSTLHREARRPGHLDDPRIPLPLHTNGDPAAPPSRNEFGTTQQRSKSVQPSGGLHDVLLNQIVSSVSEEIAVLVCVPFARLVIADTIRERG